MRITAWNSGLWYANPSPNPSPDPNPEPNPNPNPGLTLTRTATLIRTATPTLPLTRYARATHASLRLMTILAYRMEHEDTWDQVRVRARARARVRAGVRVRVRVRVRARARVRAGVRAGVRVRVRVRVRAGVRAAVGGAGPCSPRVACSRTSGRCSDRRWVSRRRTRLWCLASHRAPSR